MLEFASDMQIYQFYALLVHDNILCFHDLKIANELGSENCFGHVEAAIKWSLCI